LESAIRTSLFIFQTTGLIVAFVKHSSIETGFFTFNATKTLWALLLSIVVRVNVHIDVCNFVSDDVLEAGGCGDIYFV